MPNNDKYDITDLISTAIDQKPTEFTDTFNSLILDRLRTAVDNRKQEIAATMFNRSEVEASEEE